MCVGSEQNGSNGLSTLLCSHASLSGAMVSLEFPGKSGQKWGSVIIDAGLAGVLRTLKRNGADARLLAWRDGTSWNPLSAIDINAYVAERTGGEFTAQGFRTLHGTITAAVRLAAPGPQKAPTARKRAVAHVMRDVTEVLGNTPAVGRASLRELLVG